jgi:hypothetical protein
MKSTEATFRFPVLGFTRDREIWGFLDLDTLTKCGPRTLRDNAQDGMELVDADGRRWVVRSIRRLGRAGSWISLLLPFGPPQSRIEQELDPLDAVPLSEVQALACAAIEAHAENHLDDDDESGLEPLLAKVRRTRKIADIYQLLQPDTFEPN